ncbi:hypothetical protein BDQ94DRAFT_162986 [Aspergillus welwitschiae]|uniref:Uncharacterized protein n=1 Tax=Aspergillus welwitschiae TaxID=1341132 RepID=A0A3F3PN92_9EURO|nr:hypothetical protein BDQ94DRAFT_162986 [Aspergillus welwitschiae]RDH28298.1 hypothetical protein BDQ94DRAFT_162986 [Aspergillus welwitschiae]
MYLCWRERTLIAGLLLAETATPPSGDSPSGVLLRKERSIAGSEGIARCSLLAGVAILPDQRRRKEKGRVRGPGQLVLFQSPLIGHSPKYLEWCLASLAGHQLNAGSSWTSCTGEARRRNVSRADSRSAAVAPDSGKDRGPTAPTVMGKRRSQLGCDHLGGNSPSYWGKVTGRCQELPWNVQRRGMSIEQGAVETGTTRFFNSASQLKGSLIFMVAWGEMYMPWPSWRPSWPSQSESRLPTTPKQGRNPHVRLNCCISDHLIFRVPDTWYTGGMVIVVTWIEARSRLINVDDVLNPSMTDHAMRSVMGSEREPWMECLMSGGGFSSTARGVNDDSPIDRVQDPHPSIMMVVRGTGGQCRVGGMKLAVARVADHETGKRHLVAVPVWRPARIQARVPCWWRGQRGGESHRASSQRR